MTKRSKRLTVYDIARMAGTSKSTVSRILTNNPRVAPETRERVMEIIRAHDYTPNLAARGLSVGRNGIIAAVSSSISAMYYVEILHGLNDFARTRNVHLMTSFAPTQEEYVETWKNLVDQGFVDGVILIAPDSEVLKQDLPTSIKTVTCSARAADNPSWESVSTITVNNRAAFRQLMTVLWKQGKRNFVHVAGQTEAYDALERLAGFEEFIAAHQDCAGTVLQSDRLRETGYRVVAEFLSSSVDTPDAIVCFNDANAVGAIKALNDMGIDPKPTVTGCDDEPIADYMGFPTLKQPVYDMGYQAAKMLLDRIEAKEDPGPTHRVMEMLPLFDRTPISVFDLT